MIWRKFLSLFKKKKSLDSFEKASLELCKIMDDFNTTPRTIKIIGGKTEDVSFRPMTFEDLGNIDFNNPIHGWKCVKLDWEKR